VKPNISSVEVHPQLSNKGHPVDGVLVGAGSLWPIWRVVVAASNCAKILFLGANSGQYSNEPVIV
jgi:hypothetical protein